MTEEAVILDRVSVVFDRKPILKDVSLTAEPGKITVILGKNGSGKTTLLRTAAGFNRKYSGAITLGALNLRNAGEKAIAEHLAFMPQNLPRVSMSVRDLVGIGRYASAGHFGSLSAEDREKVDAAIRTAGIELLADRSVYHLSGGERQLAYFAMLLAKDSPIAMLDEPTASLDAVYAKDALARVRLLRDSGKTVLLVLHDLNAAVSVADRIAVLDHGGIAFYGDPSGFIRSGLPESLFGARHVCAVTGDGEAVQTFLPL